MATKQEIELALRASDTGTKKTFDGVRQSVQGLTSDLVKQVDALEKGDAKASDLQRTLNGLKAAGTELAREQGLIEVFTSLSERLEQAQTKAAGLREDANRLAAEQASQTNVTRAQTTELRNLQRDADKADKAVLSLAKSTDNAARRLELAGINTRDLAGATAAIATAAQQTGTAIRAVSTAIENYDAILEGLSARERESAEASRAAAVARSAELLKEQAFIADVTTALREMTAAERAQAAEDEEGRIRAAGNAYQRFEAQATRAAAAERTRTQAAKEAADAEEALNGFRKVADDALAASRNLTSFGAAESRAAETTSTLRGALNELLAPGEAALKTLDGVEAQANSLTAAIGEAEKPFANYQAELLGLARTQASVLDIAGKVDGYRAQADEVERARANFAEQRAELERVATAMKAADAPSSELTAGLREQQAAVTAAGRAVANEQKTLAELASGLQQAGVDVNELVGAENRLRGVAETTAAAQARLQKASQGNKGGAFAFLGLSPYALTNLGYQVNDVVTQLASGTHIEQVFAQQGGQILQIFPGIFSKIIGFLPVLAVAGAAFGGLYVAIHHAFEQRDLVRDFEAQLVEMGGASSATAQQLTEITNSLTHYGLKTAEAKELTIEFLRDGLNPARFVQFGQAAKDLADVTGQKLPAAAQALSQGFGKGYDGVLKLNDSFHFLTPALNDNIRALFEAGQSVEARTLAFNAFRDKVHDTAQEAKGPGVEAFRALGNAIKDFFTFSIVNDPAYDGLIKLLDLADKVASGFNKAHDAAARLNAVPLAQTSQPDRELLAKTALLEDGRNVSDAASAIANRSRRSGQSIGDTIRARGQYEGVDDKFGNFDATKLAKIDTNSKQFAQALAVVDKVLAGLDTVNGAVNFLGADLQKKLGRKSPAFAQAGLITKDDTAAGGNVYFGGTFNGDKGRRGPATQSNNAPVNDPANNEVEIQLRNLLKDAQDQFVQQTKQSYQDRIDQARQAAVLAVADKGGDPTKGTGLAYVQQAVATATRLADLDRRQLSLEIGSEIAGLQKSVEGAQTQTLEGVYKGIHDQVDVLRQRITDNANKGLPNIQIAGVTTTLDQARKLLDTLEQTSKVTAATGFYEKQLGDLTLQRAAAIQKINDDAAQTLITPEQQAARILAVTAEFQPKFAALAKSAGDLRDGLKGAKPDPALLTLIEQAKAAGPAALADANKQVLAIKESQVNAITSQRDQAFANITSRISDAGASNEDIADAYQQAIALQGTYNDKIRQGAQAAIDFARSLQINGQSNPALDAFIAKQQKLIDQANRPNALSSPAAKAGASAQASEESKLSEMISERNTRVSALNDLENQGLLLDKDRRAQTQAIYAESAPLILQQIADERKLLDTRLKNKDITQQAYDAEVAKLGLVATQAQYVDENFTKLRDTIINSLAQGGVQAIDSAAEAVGNFAAGTESAKDAITDIGRAAVNFFAQFLRDIANALLQMEALQAIKNLPFLNGLTSSILDTTGLGASATALAGAGGSLVAGGTALTAAAGPLGISAAAIEAAAASLTAAAGAETTAATTQAAASSVALIHGGGIVGSPGGQRRSGVSPLAFIGAPRYHSGSTGIGLRSDEQAAVLQRGEEVLSKDDPRNRNNPRGKSGQGGGGAGPDVAFRHVLVLDQDQIPAAMAGGSGEQVTLTHIKTNLPTIRSWLRG